MIDREDIQDAWDEAEELHCSLRELNDEELVDCRKALITRVAKIMIYLEDD
tara:strand:+ start:2562 stop:2714 length:153 start_codon:yes stop_codon:yes gene_type:complete